MSAGGATPYVPEPSHLRQRHRDDLMINESQRQFATPPEDRVPTPLKDPNVLSSTASNHLSLNEYFSGELAQAFIGLDRTLLKSINRVLDEDDRDINYDILSQSDLLEVRVARDTIEKHERLLKPSSHRIGARELREILNNEELLDAWYRSRSLFRAIFRPEHRGKALGGLIPVIINNVQEMLEIASSITQNLQEAGDDLQIEPETREYFCMRWTYLHDIRKVTGKSGGQFVTLPACSTMSNLIRTSPIKTGDPLSGPSSTPKLSDTTSILWLTALITLVTIPTAACALQYSDHKPGTTKQADFWYLLQNCSMVLLNLATLGIPIWRRQALPGQSWAWTWGFIAVAVVCAIVAPVMYIFVPTEWSAYMAIVTGILQAFVMLQIALVADSAGAKVIKKD